MAQVAFHFELGIEVEIGPALAQFTAKLGAHALVRQVGDVAEHARDHQAAPGHHAKVVVMAVVKIGIGENRLAGDFIEGDVLR